MVYCPKCGKEIPDGSAFCPGCGAKVDLALAPAEREAKQIENLNASQPYTTVQYQPGYEQSVEPPKRKINKAIPAISVLAVIIIVAAVGVINYFNGDAYKYKKAVELLNAGEYETAFQMLNDLGDYEDAESLLPFHGKYTNISIGDERTITFKNNEYTKVIPSSDGDNTYSGKVVADVLKSAVLTDDDGDTEKYVVFENYIYQVDYDRVIFEGKIDVSDGYFNGVITEELDFTLSSYDDVINKMKYSFSDDGTYTFEDDLYFEGEKQPFGQYPDSGTYEIDGNLITLTSNEDGDKKSFLVIDGIVYRNVYEREY